MPRNKVRNKKSKRLIPKKATQREFEKRRELQLKTEIDKESTAKTDARIKIFLLIFCLIGGLAVAAVYLSSALKYEAAPVRSAQAEVVEKVEKQSEYEGKGYYNFHISFKFHDGTTEKIRISNFIADAGSAKRASVYDAIQIGDTGILTYKDIDGGFLSFQKDRENGGQKVEFHTKWTNKSRTTTLVLVAAAYAIILATLLKQSVAQLWSARPSQGPDPHCK